MQYMYSKTGDEGSIYAARQGMRACNNTNMHNPIIKDVGGLRMLLLFIYIYIIALATVIFHMFCLCYLW